MDAKTLHKIIVRLNKTYRVRPPRIRPFRVLIGVILSHRTTDEVSHPATNRLFKKADTPEKILKLSAREIAKTIFPVGFYKTKAKRIRKVCRILLKKYGGKIPKMREDLMKFPGVGGKSADIVLSFGFAKPVIAVDSHVQWVSYVLGIAEKRNENPEKIREKLHRLIPEKDRLIVNNLFVEFGRKICNTGRPKCYMCPIVKMCPYLYKNLKLPK